MSPLIVHANIVIKQKQNNVHRQTIMDYKVLLDAFQSMRKWARFYRIKPMEPINIYIYIERERERGKGNVQEKHIIPYAKRMIKHKLTSFRA